MTKHILAFAVTVTMAVGAVAQDVTTSYNFLDITSSSRVYALGGHNISIVDDDVMIGDQNPAMLGPELNKQVGVSYMRYLGSSNFFGARYGQGVDEHSAFSVGIQNFGYGTFEGYDVTGTYTGDFSANDIVVNAAYSRDINDYWRGGINAKYVYSKYEDYTAGALGVDLGINYYNADHEFSFSMVAKNLGGQVKKFTDEKVNLPWDVQLGVSKQFTGLPVRISATMYHMRKWHEAYYEPADKNNSSSELVKKDSFGRDLFRHLVFGVEFLPSNNIYAAIGYNYRTRTDMSSYQRGLLSGFSAGAGIKVKAFGIGIALAQPHTGATTFMFNLTTNIGELLR
ncbi:MAG: type IX secretion system protein PorQ [Bacteroidales bacterium]|nr:type IX secretion system protein PorQ [Candidatus Sodaliphilus aphodohippi]